MTALRPYLIRAIYEWIVDNDMTPYILVDAESEGVNIPRQFVQDGRIVLNLHPEAVVNLLMGNEELSFQARFGGTPTQVQLPIHTIQAIYAKETGKGMVFDEEMDSDSPPPEPTPAKEKEKKPKRPTLKVVK
ncbi:ClpXP protease specificity-enhancing factor [Methylohalobius crimeensis]|uniref:ClpXP protease specificity-enhancing factor n=1 Tax=Methylohalobius crimeensis TaxID=244365 RepID=UPI0003B5F77C|nr:ClpXP protease specificity-enhancing factor [Methylohalobius crimeensis]